MFFSKNQKSSPRDNLKPPDYWDKYINYLEKKSIPKFEKLIKQYKLPANRLQTLHYAVFRNHIHLLVAKYSRGDDFITLQKCFSKVVSTLENYQKLPDIEPSDFVVIDHYERALWLVSCAIVFDYNQADFEKLLMLLGNEGSDALFERLITFRVAGRKQTKEMLYPFPYKFLYEAIDAPVPEQQQLISLFLANYYAGLKDAYWYNYDKLGDAYFGYWCFELAVIVHQKLINNVSFADNNYYPYDLAHYQR